MSKNPIPQGKYKPAVRYGNLIFTAGMTPRKDGVLLMSGKISPDRPLDDYRDAVIQAASNALTAAQNTLGEGEKIVQILSLTVYLNATEDYTTHAKVGDIVSGWLYEQLGDAGIGARAAIGLATLPGNAPVEVQLVAAAESNRLTDKTHASEVPQRRAFFGLVYSCSGRAFRSRMSINSWPVMVSC